MSVTHPLIHLNGTSREELVRVNSDAYQAIAKSIELLHKAAPHPRDFYPKGDNVYVQARKEHDERCRLLRVVLMELYDMLMGMN